MVKLVILTSDCTLDLPGNFKRNHQSQHPIPEILIYHEGGQMVLFLCLLGDSYMLLGWLLSDLGILLNKLQGR